MDKILRFKGPVTCGLSYDTCIEGGTPKKEGFRISVGGSVVEPYGARLQQLGHVSIGVDLAQLEELLPEMERLFVRLKTEYETALLESQK